MPRGVNCCAVLDPANAAGEPAGYSRRLRNDFGSALRLAAEGWRPPTPAWRGDAFSPGTANGWDRCRARRGLNQLALASLPVGLSQFFLEDLAGGIARQLSDEVDGLGALE